MKVDIMNITNTQNSTQRGNNKASKESDSFDKLFTRVSYVNNKRNTNSDSNNTEGISNQSKREIDSRSENNNVNNKVEDDSTKTVPKEIKDELKKSGMSEEEVEKINSLEDLKEKVEPDKLISILLSFMNLNVDDLDGASLKTQIVDQIKEIVNSNPEIFTNIKDQSQFKNELINGLFQKLSKELNVTSENLNNELVPKNYTESEASLATLKDSLKNVITDKVVNSTISTGDKQKVDLLPKIQQELVVALKEGFKDVKEKESNPVDALSNLKLLSKNLISQESNGISGSTKVMEKEEESSTMFSNSSETDDSFLKNLLSKDTDKISKAVNFISHLNNMKVDNSAHLADIEKVIINKNTVNGDIIKTLKFMQINNMKELTVKIMPRELGEVIINLTMDGGAMKANITATNKEAYNLLNSNLQDITSKLQNNDIKIQNLTLNIYNEDTTFFKNGNERDRNGSNGQKERKTNGIEAVGEVVNETDNLSEVDSNVDMLA